MPGNFAGFLDYDFASDFAPADPALRLGALGDSEGGCVEDVECRAL